jgi:hypothetical protein
MFSVAETAITLHYCKLEKSSGTDWDLNEGKARFDD